VNGDVILTGSDDKKVMVWQAPRLR
jgi:hypothetical protein